MLTAGTDILFKNFHFTNRVLHCGFTKRSRCESDQTLLLDYIIYQQVITLELMPHGALLKINKEAFHYFRFLA